MSTIKLKESKHYLTVISPLFIYTYMNKINFLSVGKIASIVIVVNVTMKIKFLFYHATHVTREISLSLSILVQLIFNWVSWNREFDRLQRLIKLYPVLSRSLILKHIRHLHSYSKVSTIYINVQM